MMSREQLQELNRPVFGEFRANGGVVGGVFEGMPLLLLTTFGAKSGRKTTSPLVYGKDGDRLLIFGSKGGAPTHPDWYHNLAANPRVTVEIGTETYEADAVIITGEERDRLYAAHAQRWPQFTEYAKMTTRVIPVVELRRVDG